MRINRQTSLSMLHGWGCCGSGGGCIGGVAIVGDVVEGMVMVKSVFALGLISRSTFSGQIKFQSLRMAIGGIFRSCVPFMLINRI